MGELRHGRGSYLVSARRGYLDLLNNLMNNEFKLEPSYHDLLGKVEYELNDAHRVSLHGFVANDTYGLSEKVLETNQSVNVDSVDSEYGNAYGWLTLKSVLSPDLYARTILYAAGRHDRLLEVDPQRVHYCRRPAHRADRVIRRQTQPRRRAAGRLPGRPFQADRSPGGGDRPAL